ncbi:3-isopropylmalate/(R)-2-methylmalate dehydratase small subunit [Terribacillus aidingensis]|uniref:3-isopropylmalate dehydratase small subunit n=1 Tax=Terribacillus aidingensis TaxID=586416 RepID=A0A285NWS3_9BACI|nr:3-isopropylmalate dehydratase small subunit [Terribacillus aidingensis]SNZ13942.1 3-isopropylmalate/(R)-2-methylmalate dehydratase small subunit [Terribacillus aidingensis]
MEPINTHNGLVYPLPKKNVDTDQIIPKQFLKRIERSGFGQFLFYNWRFDDEGQPRQDFTLNEPKYKGASVLIAGDNFGCGSSREHAPWALLDYGFKVIIAPSFADIFYSNTTKNGILAIKLSEAQVDYLLKQAEKDSYILTIDLKNQIVYDNLEFKAGFDIPAYQKHMLLNGLDEIGITLTYADQIKQFEQTHN